MIFSGSATLLLPCRAEVHMEFFSVCVCLIYTSVHGGVFFWGSLGGEMVVSFALHSEISFL